LVVALAVLFAICEAVSFRTVHGLAIQLNGLRQRVDPHWKRGLSYLKIGLRWLRGVFYKGRQLLSPVALSYQNTQPCFASKKAKKQYYDAIWFSRIHEIKCSTVKPF
jgi:hypothetical protein